MAKNLNEKQKKFLEALFTEAKGDVLAAKKIAGYSDKTMTSDIVNVLKDEINELTKAFIARSAPKAVTSIYDVLEHPEELGQKLRLTAAKDLLDRAGFRPTEKVEVSAPNPLFILPAKQDE